MHSVHRDHRTSPHSAALPCKTHNRTHKRTKQQQQQQPAKQHDDDDDDVLSSHSYKPRQFSFIESLFILTDYFNVSAQSIF